MDCDAVNEQIIMNGFIYKSLLPSLVLKFRRHHSRGHLVSADSAFMRGLSLSSKNGFVGGLSRPSGLPPTNATGRLTSSLPLLIMPTAITATGIVIATATPAADGAPALFVATLGCFLLTDACAVLYVEA